MNSTRELGNKYESVACRYLEQKGYEIVGRNYFCKNGEIDIVAVDPQSQLVFVEVKARSNDEYGGGESALTFVKKEKIKKSIASYLSDYEINHDNWRGDLIAITANYQHRKFRIRHYKFVF